MDYFGNAYEDYDNGGYIRCAQCEEEFHESVVDSGYIDEMDAWYCTIFCYNELVKSAQEFIIERVGPLEEWEVAAMKLELRSE